MKESRSGTRNYIDYIQIKERFRNSVTQVRIYPHNRIVVAVKVKLRKLMSKTPQINL